MVILQFMKPMYINPCQMLTEMGAHLKKHGDGVKDIAFAVENCKGIYKVGFHFSVICLSRQIWRACLCRELLIMEQCQCKSLGKKVMKMEL
jgi:hypothetical protein